MTQYVSMQTESIDNRHAEKRYLALLFQPGHLGEEFLFYSTKYIINNVNGVVCNQNSNI